LRFGWSSAAEKLRAAKKTIPVPLTMAFLANN